MSYLWYRFMLLFPHVRALEDKVDQLMFELDEQDAKLLAMIKDNDAMSEYMGKQGLRYSLTLKQLAEDIEAQRQCWEYPMQHGDEYPHDRYKT
jgi:regulator of replication initiation timing